MEKSIESIWKKGFINNESLIAPKINALYEKKSINFVDKFIRDFKINLWAILVFSIVPIIIGYLSNALIAGILINTLLLYTTYFGKKRLEILKSLEKTSSSYQYIKQFNTWLQETIKHYTNIYRIVYPSVFILSIIITWEGVLKEEIVKNFQPEELFMGMPIIWSCIVFIVALIISALAKKIYQLDMNIVYKAQFDKLKVMIEDMEELRKEEE